MTRSTLRHTCKHTFGSPIFNLKAFLVSSSIVVDSESLSFYFPGYGAVSTRKSIQNSSTAPAAPYCRQALGEHTKNGGSAAWTLLSALECAESRAVISLALHKFNYQTIDFCRFPMLYIGPYNRNIQNFGYGSPWYTEEEQA